MGLIIRSSSIHAAGCYTTSSITKGVKVVEYTGPRISKREADKRFEDSKITYLFAIGNGSTVINGMGVAMYINHSCDPNCETEEIDGRVWVMSLRPIAPGEELTYDYGIVLEVPHTARLKKKWACLCGSPKCTGTLLKPKRAAKS